MGGVGRNRQGASSNTLQQPNIPQRRPSMPQPNPLVAPKQTPHMWEWLPSGETTMWVVLMGAGAPSGQCQVMTGSRVDWARCQ